MASVSLPDAVKYIRVFASCQISAPNPVLPDGEGNIVFSGTGALTTEYSLSGVGRIVFQGVIQNATQSAKISALSQQLVTENIVTLFELDLTRYGSSIARFTTEMTENNQPLRWGGHGYWPCPVSASGFERRSSGAQPRPTLTLSNVNPIVSGLVIEGRDLVGCVVRRIRTFRRFLDDGAEPSTIDHWPIEIYMVERKKSQNKIFVEFELSGILDQEGDKLPKRQILRDYCSYVYRSWDSAGKGFVYNKGDPCPYAGGACFNKNGAACIPSQDACGKKLRDCRLRFGQNGPLPFRGFPGAGVMQ